MILTKDPPKIFFFTPSQGFVEGKSVSLLCNVTGSHPLNVTWRRLGGQADPEGSVKQFLSINRSDEAVYQCRVENGDDCSADSAKTKVSVIYKPESTSLSSSTSVACHGDRITLNCTSHAKPPPHNYQFLRNGVSIANTSDGLYTYIMHVNGTNVYTCVPENIVGAGERAYLTVQVKVSPIILSVTESQDVNEGSNLALVCNVWDNSGSLQVSWYRVNGSRLSNSSSHTITAIQRSQTGSFECHTSNGNECETRSHRITINVKYPPSILQFSPTSQTIDENDDIVLMCKTDGFPKPTISWSKLDNSTKVIHTGDTLVRKSTPSAEGTYQCSVSNGVGPIKTKAFSIKVLGYCSQHQCRPGSKCVSLKKSYYCKCNRGLRGRHCEFEDPIGKQFDVFLVFEKPTWTDKFKEKTSTEFKDFETKICKKMFQIFGKILIHCSVKYMRFGSVETELNLQFNQSKLESEVDDGIKNATFNGTTLADGLVFKDPGKIKATAFAKPCAKEPCKFDGVCKEDGQAYKCECVFFRHGKNCEKGIGMVPGIIIILACFLLLFIILILICIYCRRKSESYEKDMTENGTKMNPIHHKSNADHVASSENYSFEEQYLKSGKYEHTKEKRSPSPEFESFNKKKPIEEPVKTTSQAAIYTDVVSAMFSTPDDHHYDEKLLKETPRDAQVDENENKPLVKNEKPPQKPPTGINVAEQPIFPIMKGEPQKTTSVNVTEQPMFPIMKEGPQETNAFKVKENENNRIAMYGAPSEPPPSNSLEVPERNPVIHYGNTKDVTPSENVPLVRFDDPKETPNTFYVHENEKKPVVRFEEKPKAEPSRQLIVNEIENKTVYRYIKSNTVKVNENESKPQEEEPSTLNVNTYDHIPTVRFDDTPIEIANTPPVNDKDKKPVRRITKPPVPLPNIIKAVMQENKQPQEATKTSQLNGNENLPTLHHNEPLVAPPNKLTVNENGDEPIVSNDKPAKEPVIDVKVHEEVSEPLNHHYDNTLEEAPVNGNGSTNEMRHGFDLDPKESEDVTLNKLPVTRM